jgi:GH25 family lysozyme M1 (1,4-beta-N-acetylmuramidase)
MKFKGIDVSKHQGTIDWDKVKASGIEVAIVRCGYGSDIVSQDDTFLRRILTRQSV